MRKLGWLTAAAMCGAVTIVACGDEDLPSDNGGAGTRDAAAEARAGGDAGPDGSAGSGGQAGAVATGGTGGSGGSAAGTGGSGGTSGAGAAGTGGSATGGVGGTGGTVDSGREAAAGAAGTSAVPDAAADVGSVPDAATDVGPTPDASEASIDGAAGEAEAVDASFVGEASSDVSVSTDAGAEATAVFDATNEAAADSAAEAAADATVAPTVYYSFESGLQGWQADEPMTIATSTALADSGTASLAVTMNGADFKSIYGVNPPSGLNPGHFTFRIYIPAATTLTVLQPYTMTNGDHAPTYSWRGQWRQPEQIAAIPRDSWQTVTVQVDTLENGLPRTEPFAHVGVQLSGTGVVYIDSVAW